MMRHRSIHLVPVLIALSALMVAGCAENKPYRTAGEKTCAVDCVDATIEHHDDQDHGETYDLAFVEFTERGNVFDRDQMEEVLGYVSGLAHPQQEGRYKGVLVVVFVHGWKHNAAPGDPNVDDFRDLLRKAARLSVNGQRKVVGVYVGWRGASVTLPGIEQITYWERKNVAEQVGKGGVTELLTRLERIVIDEDQPNRDLFLVVGHSFGGAIVLSALTEVLLERVVTAVPVRGLTDPQGRPCVRTRPFGHGVVLLNPAEEANEAFQLKEVVARKCYPPDQVRLMHVITSDADSATGWIFPIGQWFGMLRWQEAQLDRSDHFAVHEAAIDRTAIGHFLPFQTGQLCSRGSERPECEQVGRPDDCYRVSPDGNRTYISYAGREDCVDAGNTHHIPVGEHEPLAFIQTDKEFIGDHNDVFTDQVAAYLAAILVEARHKRGETSASMRDDPILPVCADEPENFGKCLHAYEAAFTRIELDPPEH